MARGTVAAVSVGVLVVLAGCGQTDYASQVTEDSAQLNGTLTTLTENVTTRAWFEYWPAATPGAVQETTHHEITATGPFDTDIGDLDNHTEYRYRLCATEDDSDTVCAQTRHFTTGRDTVQAYGETEHLDVAPPSIAWIEDIDFDLVADESNVAGTGFLELHSQRFEDIQTNLGGPGAQVTCFDVNGNTAIIGLFNPNAEPSQGFAQLVDGGPVGSAEDTAAAKFNFPGGPQRDPSDCTSPIANQLRLTAGEVSVNEAPPPPT